MNTKTSNANSGGKKKGGSFLARQAKARDKKTGMITEEELLDRDIVTPDDILMLTRITESESRCIIVNSLLLAIFRIAFNCFRSLV